MKKVTIEITDSGWQIKLQLNEKVATQTGQLTPTGSTHDNSFDEVDWVSDELYEALDSFFCHDVATALEELEIEGSYAGEGQDVE